MKKVGFAFSLCVCVVWRTCFFFYFLCVASQPLNVFLFCFFFLSRFFSSVWREISQVREKMFFSSHTVPNAFCFFFKGWAFLFSFLLLWVVFRYEKERERPKSLEVYRSTHSEEERKSPPTIFWRIGLFMKNSIKASLSCSIRSIKRSVSLTIYTSTKNFQTVYGEGPLLITKKQIKVIAEDPKDQKQNNSNGPPTMVKTKWFVVLRHQTKKRREIFVVGRAWRIFSPTQKFKQFQYFLGIGQTVTPIEKKRLFFFSFLLY